MCGIAGIFDFKASGAEPLLPQVEVMLELMRHRGPDGRGSEVLENLALGHVRLAILDLSERGRQPMQAGKGRYWISYNGEIYNYLELREELRELGYQFQTDTDTEVILRAYEHWGRDCFCRFNGMWALALWDNHQKQLVLCRDRVGIKPLYICQDGDRLAFASELKALIAYRQMSGLPVQIENQSLQSYLSSGLVDGLEPTFIKNIFRFRSGHYLIADQRGVQAYEPYWDLPSLAAAKQEELRGLSRQDLAANLLAVLEDAVTKHTRSDVPVGICLSGGLDSSCVAAFASRLIPSLNSFTTWYEEGKAYDESEHAQRINRRFSLAPHLIKVDGGQLLDQMPQMLWHLDEPTLAYGIYSMWEVMKAAAKEVTVVMDGQGGDELFAGYDFYAPTFIYSQMLAQDQEAVERTLNGFEANYGGGRRQEIWLEAQALAQQNAVNRLPSRFKGVLNNFLFQELTSSRLPALLRNEDRLSMAFSIESRVPLLDYRLMEFAFALDEGFKVGPGWSKHIFREALKDQLPPEVTWRKDKMGFPTPFEVWASGIHKEAIRQTVLNLDAKIAQFIPAHELNAFFQAWDQGNKNVWMLWRLFSLEIWLGFYLDRVSREVAAAQVKLTSHLGPIKSIKSSGAEAAMPMVSDSTSPPFPVSASAEVPRRDNESEGVEPNTAGGSGLCYQGPGGAEALLEQGRSLMSQGHHAAAAEKLGQLARLEPGHHLAHNLLGICHMMNDLAPQAADAFARAHFLAPNNCTYLANLAKAQFLNRDLDGARQNLQQALESAPEEQRPELLALLEKCQFQGAQALPQVSEIAPPKPDKVRMPESWMDDELTRQLAPPGKAAQQVKEDARALDGVRVLHAPSEIAGNLERISRHLNKVGVQSTSLNYGLNTWAKYKCDINLDLPHLTPQKRAQVVQEVFEKALNEYDIFHFHFTRSFDANFKDLEILKDRGKKIIFSFWGSDHRSDECVDFHQACFLGHNPPAPYFNSSDYQKAQRLINRYADVMFGLACFPRGMFVPGYMDTGQWHPAEKEALAAQANKDPHKLYLVHAPSDPRYKGSAVIIQLLEECKKQGLPLEVIYVSGLELAEAKKQYALADCAVDQIATGTFGSFGSEMMLWETPILIYQDECLRKIRRDPPVIHVTKDSFVDQVARCLEMKKSGELAQLGRRSRKWVLSHLEITTHGLPVYLKVYRLLMENRSVPQYFNLDWQQQDAMMAAGVKSDFYRYMTDHRIYEEIGIPVPSRDQRLYN